MEHEIEEIVIPAWAESITFPLIGIPEHVIDGDYCPACTTNAGLEMGMQEVTIDVKDIEDGHARVINGRTVVFRRPSSG